MQQTCGQIFLIGNLSKNVGLPHRLNCYYRTFQNFTKASLWIQIFVRIEKKSHLNAVHINWHGL